MSQHIENPEQYPVNRKEIPDEQFSLGDGIVACVYKDLQDPELERIEVVNHGEVIATYVRHKGKIIEESATADFQRTGLHKNLSVALGQKESEVFYSNPKSQVVQEAIRARAGEANPVDRSMQRDTPNVETKDESLRRPLKDKQEMIGPEKDKFHINKSAAAGYNFGSANPLRKMISRLRKAKDGSAYIVTENAGDYKGVHEHNRNLTKSEPLQKNAGKPMHGTHEVHVSFDSGKLRKLRDMINERGGKMSTKEVEKLGFSPKALGIEYLKDPKGNLSASSIQNYIDALPKHEYHVDHTEYGTHYDAANNDPTDEDFDRAWSLLNDENPFSEYVRNDAKAYEEMRDRAHELVTQQYNWDGPNPHFDPEQPESEDNPKKIDYSSNPYDDVHIEDHPSYDERMEEVEPEAIESLEGGRHHDRWSDMLGEYQWQVAREIQLDRVRNGDESSSDAKDDYENALHQQRHSPELSQVFQLNYTPEQEKRMKDAGVYNTFKSIHNASRYASHPAGEHTLGWVRYTEGPSSDGKESGIHIDEIQSDFGQKFNRLAALRNKAKKENRPEWEASGTPEHEALKIPEGHLEKINEILFQGRAPSEVIHEGFLQHNRDQGNVGENVHIWQANPKGRISGMRVPNKEQAVVHYSKMTPSQQVKAHKAESANSPAQNKYHVVDKETGNYIGEAPDPLPVHMQQTYNQHPPKMGYEPAEYGELTTQENPSLKGEPTWKHKLRKMLGKSKEQLLEKSEKLRKDVVKFPGKKIPSETNTNQQPNTSDPEYADRLSRIRGSLGKINALMGELKQREADAKARGISVEELLKDPNYKTASKPKAGDDTQNAAPKSAGQKIVWDVLGRRAKPADSRSRDQKIKDALASQKNNPFSAMRPSANADFGHTKKEDIINPKAREALDEQERKYKEAALKQRQKANPEKIYFDENDTGEEQSAKAKLEERNREMLERKKAEDLERPRRELANKAYKLVHGEHMMSHRDIADRLHNESSRRDFPHKERIPGSNQEVKYLGEENGHHYFSSGDKNSWKHQHYVVSKNPKGKLEVSHIPKRPPYRIAFEDFENKKTGEWETRNLPISKVVARYTKELSQDRWNPNKGASAGATRVKQSSKYKELAGKRAEEKREYHPKDFERVRAGWRDNELRTDRKYGGRRTRHEYAYHSPTNSYYSGNAIDTNALHHEGKIEPMSNMNPEQQAEDAKVFEHVISQSPEFKARHEGKPMPKFVSVDKPKRDEQGMVKKPSPFKVIKSQDLKKSILRKARFKHNAEDQDGMSNPPRGNDKPLFVPNTSDDLQPTLNTHTTGKAQNLIGKMKDNRLNKSAEGQNKVRSVADSYAKTKGLQLKHGEKPAEVSLPRAQKIAQAYDSMPHNPNDPAVKNAYGALASETMDQFKHMKNSGLKISPMEPGMENPYKTSKDMFHDIHHNNHLWFFPTEQGFGSGDVKDHPLLAQSGEKIGNHNLLHNDVLRIVHDYFGHAKEGHGFGPKGEENAWREHMQMYSPEAQKALTSETRGQNSWVNFGPHGEHNKKNPHETKYAEQKAGLLPDWAMEKE